jgi:hypothetical protein
LAPPHAGWLRGVWQYLVQHLYQLLRGLFGRGGWGAARVEPQQQLLHVCGLLLQLSY